jgi:mono/diheme cytochrome c family protein
MAPGADALAGDASESGLTTVKAVTVGALQRGHMRNAVLLIALALAVPVAAQAAAPDQAEARGRALVEKNCGMCHAVGRTGVSPFSPAPPFRELGQRYRIDDLAEALAEGIVTGHPAMPQFRFTPAEVNDIIHYMRSIQVRQSAAADLPPRE